MVTEVNTLKNMKGNVLVDFYTTSCAPCRALNPVLEEISNEFASLTVAKVEVTQNPQASQEFGVMSVPTLVLMQDSKVKEVQNGFSNKNAIRSMIQKHIHA